MPQRFTLGVKWVWGWWGIDISAHNKGDHSIREALCLGQFRVIESRVRSRSLISPCSFASYMCFGKMHTHTHWWLVSPAFPACFWSPDRIEGSVHFHLSESHLKRGCWHKQWIMKRCSTNWFYLKKKTHRNWIRDGRTEDWKQRSLVDGHAPVFMLERSRCCRRKLWPSWPGRCLGLAERDEIQQTHRT